MDIETRRAELIEILRRDGKVSVEALAEQLSASRETIRRDLTKLSRAGRVLKVHGGATMPRVMGEGPFHQRLSENAAAKLKIARCAARLFQPGETLFVDTGTTTLVFADVLARVSGLTVVTNSTEIARLIASAKTDSRAFLLGGYFSPGNSQTVGSMTTEHVRAFRAHHTVLTVGALDGQSGAMDFNIEEAQIARAMVERSERVTVLADGSKFGALASFEVCPLDRIDRLISEIMPPEDIRGPITQAGGQVILAG